MGICSPYTTITKHEYEAVLQRLRCGWKNNNVLELVPFVCKWRSLSSNLYVTFVLVGSLDSLHPCLISVSIHQLAKNILPYNVLGFETAAHYSFGPT